MMDPQSLEARWRADERWAGIVRPFRGEDVTRLRGSVHIEHTLARLGAERFWSLLRSEPFVPALGALTGNQAVQQVQAGLPAIYMSGWQVAADGNDAGQTYPEDRKSTRLNSSHRCISYAVFCLKKKKKHKYNNTATMI